MSSSREWTLSEYTYGEGYKQKGTGVTVEWEHETGGYDWSSWALISKKVGDQKVYAAYVDNGCSCYSSFEKHPDKYDFAWTPNLKEAASQLSRDMRDEPSDSYGWKPDQKSAALASFSAAVAKLR